MSGKPYDATVRTLIGTRPQDWLRFLNLPTGDPVTVLDTDVSVVTAATDGLLRVGGSHPYGLHFEFETGHHGAKLASRLCAYNSQASEQTGLTFWSVLVLLNSGADSPSLTGTLERRLPAGGGRRVCVFEYEVVRVWRIAPEQFIAAGLGLLPFAPTGNVAAKDAPEVIERMTDMVETAVSEARITDIEANDLWYATYVLMGPKYGKALSAQLLRKVTRMRESPTFQAIIEEGLEEGLKKGRLEGRIDMAQEDIITFGVKRFGVIPAATEARLFALRSLPALKALRDRFDAVETWDELLAETTEA